MEMIELVRKSEVISGGRSVWFCRKCSHKGEFSVTVCKQLSAGHLLSPKTVMQRSFRIDRDDRVPPDSVQVQHPKTSSIHFPLLR